MIMPYDKIDQLYDALKKDGAVSKSRENFKSFMLESGQQGYNNRKQLYDALHKDGAVQSNTYEDFAKGLGLHANPYYSGQPPQAGSAAKQVVAEYENSVRREKAQQNKSQGAQSISQLQGKPSNVPSYLNPNMGNNIVQDKNNWANDDFSKQGINKVHGINTDIQKQQVENNKPVINTGVPQENQYIIKTRGQQTDEARQSASNLNEKYISPYVDKALSDADKQARDVIDKSQHLFYSAPTGLPQGDVYHAAGMQDPDKILKGLQDDISNIYSDPSFIQNINSEANKIGISSQDYYSKYVQPKIQEQLENTFYQKEILKHMPKNKSEYLINGLTNGITGMVLSRLLPQKEVQYMNAAQQATEEGLNKDYTPTTGDKLEKFAVSFTSDAPFFGLTGKIASSTVGAVVKNQIEKLTAKGLAEGTARSIVGTQLENSVGKRVASKILQGSLSGATNLGTYNVMSESARQFRDREFNPTQILERGVSGIGTGAALGVTGGIVGGLSSKLSGAKKLLASAANYLTESGTFTATGEAEKYLKGEGKDIRWGQDFLENIEQLGVMKATGGHFMERMKNLVRPESEGVHFTKGEIDHIKTSKSANSLFSALSDMQPKDSKFVKGEVTENIKDPNISEKRNNLSKAYTDFMQDPNNTFVEKQKVAIVLGGTVPENKPLETGYRIDNTDKGSTITTTDANGNAVNMLNFNSEEEANNYVSKHQNSIKANDVSIMSENYPEESQRIFHDFIRKGHTEEGLINALSGNDNTEEGTQILNNFQQKLSDRINQANSFDQGLLTTDPQERQNVKSNLDKQTENITSLFKDNDPRLLTWLQSDPQSTIQKMKDDGYDENTISIVSNYINTKATYDGMIQGVRDEIDEKVNQNNDKINSITNKSDGLLHPATTRDGHSTYIVSGNVALFDDGTIDHNNSDKSIIIKDPSTGEQKMVPSTELDSIDQTINSEDYRKNQEEELRNYFSQKASDEIEGKLQFLPGDTYNIEDKEGNIQQVTVQQPIGDGTVQLTDGSIVPMNEVQKMSENYNEENNQIDKYKPYLSDDGKTIIPATLEDGNEVFLKNPSQNANNKYSNLDIIYKDEDGNIQTESIPATYIKEIGTPQMLEDYVKDKEQITPDDKDQSTTGTVVTDTPESPVEDGIVRDEKGMPIYEQSPVEATISDMTKQGADNNDILDYSTSMISELEKESKTLEKKKPEFSKDFSTYRANKQALLDQKEAVEKQKKYWKSVIDAVNTPKGKVKPQEQTSVVPKPQRNTGKYVKENKQMGDYLNLHDRVLRGIATGTKFLWNDSGNKKGLATELGFKGSEGERKKRIGILASAEKGGVSIDELAHNIWEEREGQPWQNEDVNDIKNEIIDVLSSHNGTRTMIDEAMNMHEQPENSDDSYEAQNYIHGFANSRHIDPEDVYSFDSYNEDKVKNDNEFIGDDELNSIFADKYLEEDKNLKENGKESKERSVQGVRESVPTGEGSTGGSTGGNKILQGEQPATEGSPRQSSVGRPTEKNNVRPEGLSNDNVPERSIPRTVSNTEVDNNTLQESPEEANTKRMSDIIERLSDIDSQLMELEDNGVTESPEITSLNSEKSDLESEYKGLQEINNESKRIQERKFTPPTRENEDPIEYAQKVSDAHDRFKEEQKVDTNPSEAQKEAGNYKKGHIKLEGYDITIENPKGSERSGKDADGKEWHTKMNNTYGYIRGTEGVDGDHIDVYLSDDPTKGDVYVVDQVDPKTGEFDEHKVMYGFSSSLAAKRAYLSNYSKDWKGLGNITKVSKEEFKKWVDSSHRKTKPFADYQSVKPLMTIEDLIKQANGKDENAQKAQEVLKSRGIDWTNKTVKGSDAKRLKEIKDAKYDLMKAKRELSVATSKNSPYTESEIEDKKALVKDAEERLKKLFENKEVLEKTKNQEPRNIQEENPNSEMLHSNLSDENYIKMLDEADEDISDELEDKYHDDGEKKLTSENIGPILYNMSSRYTKLINMRGVPGMVVHDNKTDFHQAFNDYRSVGVLDLYQKKLREMLPRCTDAAKERVQKVIDGIDYTLRYYERQADGEEMWRTADQPMFRTAYHGTDKDFDQFDLSHVGEGQGQNIAGNGIYVSDVKGVASKIKDMSKGDGYLYKVNIPDDTGSNYLDWNKTYKGEELQGIVDRIFKSVDGTKDASIKESNSFLNEQLSKHPEGVTGSSLYTLVRFSVDNPSDVLNKAGFVGTKYDVNMDQGYHGTLKGDVLSKMGKKSYSIFNEKDVKILQKEKDGSQAKETVSIGKKTEDQISSIKSSVDSISDKLGGMPVNYVDESNIPDNVKGRVDETTKGWYDPKDGSVTLYTPNITSEDDAVRTVFHEKLGHEGLKALFGSDSEVNKFGDFIFKSANKELRDEITKEAVRNGFPLNNPDGMSHAAQEVFARIAEEGPASENEFSLWRKIKHYVIDLLNKSGLHIKGILSDEDLRYYIQKTAEALKNQKLSEGSSEVMFRKEDEPKKMKGENMRQFIDRLREYNKIEEARMDKEDPMPEYHLTDTGDFAKDAAAQSKYYDDYRQWKIRHNIYDIEKADDKFYNGEDDVIADPVKDKDIYLNSMDNARLEADPKAIERYAKTDIIERRKLINGSAAEDSLFMKDISDRTDAIAKSLNTTGKDIREALPFMIEGTYHGPIKVNEELETLMDDIKSWHDEMYNFLKEEGLYGEVGYLNNYISHIWDSEKSDAKAFENFVRTKNKYMQHRLVPTYQDGIDLGLVPKYKDVTEIMAEYGKTCAESVANNRLINAFKNYDIVDGDRRDPALSTISAPGYTRISVPGISDYPMADIWVHNSIKDRFNSVFGGKRTQGIPNWLTKTAHTLDLSASVMKKINLSVSGFHAVALAETLVGTEGPARTLKDVAKYVIKESAFKGLPPAYAHPEDYKLAAKHLVRLGATDDYSIAEVQAITTRMRKIVEDFDKKHPKLADNPATFIAQTLDFMNKGFDTVLWKYIHDGFKLSGFKYYANSINQDFKDGKINGIERDKRLDEAGQMINDAFGGQFWDVINVSPALLKWMGRGLLSPDWTISTTRHGLSAMFGLGSLYSESGFQNYLFNNTKRMLGKDIPKNEYVDMRKKWGRQFYAIAFMAIGTMMNAINAYYRHKDEQDEKEKADEMRKSNPDYKSPYELAYPDGMKWYDYTMYGNSVGHQTHLFSGHYQDGTETYVRWGKQLREIPEMLYGRDGLSFPGPIIDRLSGKANPIINLTSNLFSGASLNGFDNPYMKNKRGWAKEIGRLHVIASCFLPYSIPTDEEKEFKMTDLFMPSQKGMTKWSTINHFKTAILSGDLDYVGQTYKAAVLNGIDAESCLKAATTEVKAGQRQEMSDGIKSLQMAMDSFDNAKTLDEKKHLKSKIVKYLADSGYKSFSEQEAVGKVKDFLNGDDLEDNEVNSDKYIMAATADDIRGDYKISALNKKSREITNKVQEMYSDGESPKKIQDYISHYKKWFEVKGITSGYKSETSSLKKAIGKDKDVLKKIRSLREETMKRIESLD